MGLRHPVWSFSNIKWAYWQQKHPISQCSHRKAPYLVADLWNESNIHAKEPKISAKAPHTSIFPL